MTKSELSDLVISIWEGGETTSQRKPDPREIWLIADAAMAELIYLDFKQTRDVDGRYFTSETKTVAYSQTRNKKYITLTSAPLVSPNGNALILISPLQNENKQFIMATPVEGFITDGLEVGRLKDTSFTLENTTVWFERIPNELQQVLVKLVKAISGLTENETIPIAEHLMNSVLDVCLQKIGIQKQVADKVVNIYKDGA